MWVFLLAFLFLHPRCGFFRLLISPHAQFSLRNLSISFQVGLSYLLFSSHAHVAGFSACHFLLTPSFLSATYRSASRLGFPACFSSPTPTPWVFPLARFSSRPVFSPQPINKLPGWGFLLAFLFPRPRRGFFRSLISLHTHGTQKTTAYLTIHGGSKLLFTIYFRK